MTRPVAVHTQRPTELARRQGAAGERDRDALAGERRDHRGLVAEPERDTSGYRRYGSAELLRLVQARTLAGAGVPLAEVGELLDAGPERFAAPLGDVHRRLTTPNGRWIPITVDGIELFNLATVPVTRYRYRGNTIPTPWTLPDHAMTAATVESPVR